MSKWLATAEAIDSEEDKLYGSDKQGDDGRDRRHGAAEILEHLNLGSYPFGFVAQRGSGDQKIVIR